MKRLRSLAIILLFVALLALFAVGGSSPSVKAQGGPWSVTYDFSISAQGWTAYTTSTTGAIYSGGAWHDDGPFGGDNHQALYITLDWPTGGDVSTIDITYSITNSFSDSTNDFFRAWDGAGLTGSVVCDVSSSDITGAGQSFSGTFHWATGCSAGRSWLFGMNAQTGGAMTITKIIMSGTTGSPFTPTPTSTPTQPSTGGGDFFGQCPLLGDDNSTFSNLPGSWTFNPSTLTNPSGQFQGLEFTTGSASLTLNLSRFHQYKIDLRLHISGDPGSVTWGYISVQLGSSDPITIPVPATNDPQFFATADGGLNFMPDSTDSDTYTFTLRQLLGGDAPEGSALIIDLACVSDRTPNAQIVPSGGENDAGICKDCSWVSSGNILEDFFKVLGWLWCGLSQLFSCVLRPIVMGIWQGIINILRLLSFVRLWLGTIIQNAILWLNANWGVIVAWARGTLSNIVQTLYNVAIFLLNTIPIVALINLILSFFSTPLGQIITNTAHQATTVVSTLGDLIAIGGHYMGLIFGVIIGLLGAIPIIFASLIAGFNASPTSIPVWAPTCSSTNTFLYYPCLGSYILDNTLLDGPVYLIFVLLLGLVALNTILWAIRAVQESLTQ